MAARTAGAQNACRAPSYLSEFVVDEITRYVTAASGDDSTARVAFQLPVAAANEVQLVTTDSLCAVAAAAYAADRQGVGSGTSGSVWVVKVKSVYVVYDPDYDAHPIAGQPPTSLQIVFDSSWQVLTRY